MTRDRIIRFRLTDQELEFLKDEAAREDVPVSQIMRKALKKMMNSKAETSDTSPQAG
jgi:predicted DNA binding CopG/RHH family protein